MKLHRIVVILACLVIIALSAFVPSYAYTAQTDNTGNTSVAEYSVLHQSVYTFNAAGSVDTYSIVTRGNDGNAAKMYCMTTDERLCSAGGVQYQGKLIGETHMWSTSPTSDPNSPEEMFVTISNSGTFADFTNSDWRYILKITATDKDDQYAVSNGDGTWQYYTYHNSQYSSVSYLSFFDNYCNEEHYYTVKLYLAGPELDTPDDGVNSRFVAGVPYYVSGNPAKQNDLMQYNSGNLIVNGVITFLYDSNRTIP